MYSAVSQELTRCIAKGNFRHLSLKDVVDVAEYSNEHKPKRK